MTQNTDPTALLDRRMTLKEAIERVSLEELTDHMGYNVVCWDIFGVVVSYDDSWEMPAKLYDVRDCGADVYIDRAWKNDVKEANKGDICRRAATVKLQDMGPIGKYLSIHITSNYDA